MHASIASSLWQQISTIVLKRSYAPARGQWQTAAGAMSLAAFASRSGTALAASLMMPQLRLPPGCQTQMLTHPSLSCSTSLLDVRRSMPFNAPHTWLRVPELSCKEEWAEQ